MTTKAKGNSGDRTVEVRLLNPKNTGSLIVRTIRHPETGKTIKLVDANGEETTFSLNRSRFFLNLSDPFHANVYEILKVHPIYSNASNPKIRMIDVEQEAQDKLTAIETEDEARGIVRALNSVKLANFARVLGIQTDNSSETVIKTRLYDYAKSAPVAIVEEWNNPERELKELLHRARQRGVVRISATGIWSYGNQPMGANFDTALSWLKDNEDLIDIIRKESDKIK